MAVDMKGIELQRKEFDAVAALSKRYRALPPIVDDDYPEARHYYECAIRDFIDAIIANGRISPTPPQPTAQVTAMSFDTMPPPGTRYVVEEAISRSKDKSAKWDEAPTPPLPQASKERYVLVPAEPTQEMLKAAIYNTECDDELSGYDATIGNWKAMIAAVPPAPGVVEALKAAKRLCDNINEFGHVTDQIIYDNAEAVIREALQSLEPVQPTSGGGE